MVMAGTDEETQQPRAGTYADLARRMDRMEQKHEDLAKEVAVLTATTAQVVLNQQHAEKINDLQFAAINTTVSQLGSDLKGFMARIEGMIDGTIQTAQSRAGAEMVADYQRWRRETDERVNKLEDAGARNGGIVIAIGGMRQVILVAMAAMGTFIAIAEFIDRITP